MGVTKYEELPQEAKDYVEFIETFIGVKVQYIGQVFANLLSYRALADIKHSTGPKRENMIEKL